MEFEQPNMIYSGTRWDIDNIKYYAWGPTKPWYSVIVAAIVDLPFSIIADTVLLPFGIAETIAGPRHLRNPEDEGDKDDAQNSPTVPHGQLDPQLPRVRP